jgi:inward rectifier potassium channel
VPEVPRGARKVRQQGSTFYVIGEVRRPLRDTYHWFLKAPWPVSLGGIALAFLVVNFGFAVLFMIVGGVEGSTGSFGDSLSFSVQTMATIGYGVMHPTAATTHGLVIAESMCSIVFSALATGLVFAKFSRATARIGFSAVAVITRHEGKPTLMFRVGNQRGNTIVEAQVHVVAVMTTVTLEGETFYKAIDLPLVRDRQVGMSRGWTVMHEIDERSPLHGLDATALARAELELNISVTGIDDITMQAVHTLHQYTDKEIHIGERFEDTMQLLPDGAYLLDLRNFDRVVPDTVTRPGARARTAPPQPAPDNGRGCAPRITAIRPSGPPRRRRAAGIARGSRGCGRRRSGGASSARRRGRGGRAGRAAARSRRCRP